MSSIEVLITSSEKEDMRAKQQPRIGLQVGRACAQSCAGMLDERPKERKAMTIIARKRMRSPHEKLQALDDKLSELGSDNLLKNEIRDQIRQMLMQIPEALLKSKEVQRAVAKAGDLFIEAVLLVRKHGNFPLPQL